VGLDARPPGSSRSVRRRDETAAHEILQRILPGDGRQTGNRPTAPGDDDLGAPLDPLEMLAQAIVELPDAHLVALSM